METFESTFGYDEIAQTWRGLANNGAKITGQSRAVTKVTTGWAEKPSWYGATIAEMTHRVDHGWEAEGLKVPAAAASQNRARWRYSEEGELQVETALQGHDQPFLSRQNRKRKPGVRLKLGYNFSGMVHASVIADYAKFTADLIAGMQSNGYDLEIDVFSTVTMSRSRGARMRVRTNTRVKRFGRASSLKTWGALFSPSGYRMLGFTARIMACAEHGVPCNPDMGGSDAPGWGLIWEPKTRTLTVNCNPQASSFPAEQLVSELRELKF